MYHSGMLALYLLVARLAMDNDWIMEEGWALYLEGCHFQRQGIECVVIDSEPWPS
jgi:hypothetical protein